jgi:hypothetical protein
MGKTTNVNTETVDSPVVRRLDALIALLVEWRPASEASQRSAEDQTIKLRKAGLRPVEIAHITGRALSNITRDISNARKKGRLPKSVGE